LFRVKSSSRGFHACDGDFVAGVGVARNAPAETCARSVYAPVSPSPKLAAQPA